MSNVLLLNAEELKECVPLDLDAVACIENAFHTLATQEVIMPPVLQLDIRENNGEVCIKTAYLPGLESFAIKISPGFFDNPKIGLPSGSGMMNLFNSKTGILESVLLDKGYLTDIRTAAAGAVSAKWLSNKASSHVAIIGAGIQAELQLEAVCLVRDIKHCTVWARDHSKAESFAEKMQVRLNISCHAADSVQKACHEADIIVTTTPSEDPLLFWQDIQPGQHIIAMGSDSPRKAELDSEIIVNADHYVCDRLSQVRELGELHRAIESGVISIDQEFNELGDVVAGKSSGRTGESDVTVCDLTGVGAQDTAIATLANRLAKSRDMGNYI